MAKREKRSDRNNRNVTRSASDDRVTPDPRDSVDPVAAGRVVNRLGPGLSEPAKGTGLHTSPDHAERVAADEGARGPHVEEQGFAEHSVYDGSGREVVVVTSTDEEGRPAQGAGTTTREARADARKARYPVDHTGR